MKAFVRYGALAVWIVACSPSNSAIFGEDPSPSDGGTSATAGSDSGGTATNGGTSSPVSGTNSGATSGTGAEPSEGGSAGTASGGTSAGEAPEVPGSGGENMAGAPNPTDPEPVCGNGVIEAGEECDDAGHAGEDGCNECQVVCSHYGQGTLESEDHHCYRGYDEANFQNAREACTQRGGHLITIGSAAENQVARMLVNSSKLLGGFENAELNQAGDGKYQWVTGEPFTYTNWAQNQPDEDGDFCGGWGNQRCYKHCLGMNGQGTWESHRCDQADGYICEWEPVSTAVTAAP
jgi:cysteine-rich repeat protein